MKELIEYIAKSVVDHPDDVRVEEDWRGRNRVIIRLTVHEDDMGRVIGRGGRVAQTMRQLLKVAAARHQARASLEIG